MVLKNFIFFDESSSSNTSNPLVNESHGRNLVIQVSNISASPTFSFTVQGLADLATPESWYDLSAISLSDFSVNSAVTSAGLYAIPADGLYKIRLVCSSGLGTFKAYTNMTD